MNQSRLLGEEVSIGAQHRLFQADIYLPFHVGN